MSAVPLVTLVTHVGDDRVALARLADRLARQSLTDWEWWLVSPTAIPGWLSDLARSDPRMRAIDTPPPPTGARWRLEISPGDLSTATDLETRLWTAATRAVSNGSGHAARADDTLPFDVRLAIPPPRLLLLVPWLAAGGAEKFTLDLVRQLGGRGWSCTIATTTGGRADWEAEFRAATPDVFVTPRFLTLPELPRFVRHLIASRGIETVLIAHSLFGYAVLPYLRAHFPAVTFVDYCHVVEPGWQHGGYPQLAVTYQGLLDLNVVSSAHLRDWMVARGATPGRIEVCPTNVDPTVWRPDPGAAARVRARYRVPAGTPVILHAARLCPQKQPAVLADTFRRLRDAGVDFVALIAGDGPDRALLARLLRRHRLGDRVHLLGLVSADGVRELLQAADVFFLPSRYEGIALALFEAMACGVCVLSADVGGQRELVTPACGILLPSTDPDTEAAAYADALRALLADPARRRALGEAGRERVATRFALDHMGERMASLLRSARTRPDAAPRFHADPRLAPALAEQAVAVARASELAGVIDPFRTSWRTHAYFAVRNLLEPAYARLRARDWRWAAAAKDALKGTLLRS